MANVKNKNRQSQRIVIQGELTIYTAMELKNKLLVDLSVTEELELDLSEVGEIDAAGLQLLVMIKQEATTLGKVVRFTGHSPVVVKLLDLSGLAGFFGDPLLIVYPSTVEGKSI
ncbi:STAS domain-containing protein [Methylobacter psychrophilus]|uniref:STAS domain-containing protein n=1 Tax=Methylobacter psychrophilus TaxID=96941 RepID=UPI0021D4FDD7|nr:STAS domain-containing protein [Methylobacter psychrophilus]